MAHSGGAEGISYRVMHVCTLYSRKKIGRRGVHVRSTHAPVVVCAICAAGRRARHVCRKERRTARSSMRSRSDTQSPQKCLFWLMADSTEVSWIGVDTFVFRQRTCTALTSGVCCLTRGFLLSSPSEMRSPHICIDVDWFKIGDERPVLGHVHVAHGASQAAAGALRTAARRKTPQRGAYQPNAKKKLPMHYLCGLLFVGSCYMRWLLPPALGPWPFCQAPPTCLHVFISYVSMMQVQRLLAEKFNLPGLSSQSHAEGPGKEKEKEKKGLSASRRGTQQSCVQVGLGRNRHTECRK